MYLYKLIIVLLWTSVNKYMLIEAQEHTPQPKEFFVNPDGVPAQYLSGTIHYFRVHPNDWRDRLRKLKWAGFHAVQTYIEWSSHESEPGVYSFSHELNFELFFSIAAEEGLKVIIRPGPYICAERDMGGLPYWLLRESPFARFRSSDERFMKYVRKWFAVLLPRLKPFMYEYGGPIVMVQVENEYGNCKYCDFKYLTELSSILKEELGKSTFLFSTDNGRTDALKCGKIPSLYATVDFGPDANATSEFEAQCLINGQGPLINSEYHLGWFDHWGVPHSTRNSKIVSSYFDNLLQMGASVNIYVFHGGTSFGFGAGSNFDLKFQSCPTSYDFDAPLNEAGDPTEKYFLIRNVIKKYFPVPVGPPPPPLAKFAYGRCTMTPIGSVFGILPQLNFVESEIPKTFEDLMTSNGIVVYQTVLEKSVTSPAVLTLNGVHDRAYVFVDNIYNGIASREEQTFDVPITIFPKQVLSVVVESQGRISVGPHLKDFKGLTATPKLNGHFLNGWKNIPLPIKYNKKLKLILQLNNVFPNVTRQKNTFDYDSESRMLFFYGELYVQRSASHPMDTFINFDSFTKGYVWINDFLLGRYWPVMGPQISLFIPSGFLCQGKNKIMILELEGTRSHHPIVSFHDQPNIDGPTPQK